MASEIDRLAQAEQKPRADYIVDLLWQDVRRHKQRQALCDSSGAWNHVGIGNPGSLTT